MDQKTNENFLAYCLHLAKLGIGNVSPNPPVGAVLVHNQTIIGEGFHKKFGEPHAEVNAISNVTRDQHHLIKDSSLYVSLEPCNHFGKTGPCTEFILKNEIRTVVFGCYDPNPQMAGKSIQYLKSKGINIIGPILEKESKNIIREFTINKILHRPYIILKFAQSSDYFIGKKNERTKISSVTTDLLVHRWRSEVDAILVGTNTIRVDNPYLTNRLWTGKNPVRIAMGNFTLEEKKSLHIFNEDTTTICTSDMKANDISSLVAAMYKRNIGILMIEGGAKTINTFYEAGLWDEARIITNSDLKLGTGIPSPSIRGNLEKSITLGKDVIYYMHKYQSY
jgi:diaminohydroxyphosphoribosylaminopyrimidine deaminase/5-amino-6-(5-phosphoribosylamino)uracil reductase